MSRQIRVKLVDPVPPAVRLLQCPRAWRAAVLCAGLCLRCALSENSFPQQERKFCQQVISAARENRLSAMCVHRQSGPRRLLEAAASGQPWPVELQRLRSGTNAGSKVQRKVARWTCHGASGTEPRVYELCVLGRLSSAFLCKECVWTIGPDAAAKRYPLR